MLGKQVPQKTKIAQNKIFRVLKKFKTINVHFFLLIIKVLMIFLLYGKTTCLEKF